MLLIIVSGFFVVQGSLSFFQSKMECKVFIFYLIFSLFLINYSVADCTKQHNNFSVNETFNCIHGECVDGECQCYSYYAGTNFDL